MASALIGSDHLAPLAALLKDGSPEERAALVADEADLVAAAESQSPERFRRHVGEWRRALSSDEGAEGHERAQRRNRLRLYTDEDGRGQLRGDFDPESFATIRAAIGGVADEIYAAGGSSAGNAHLQATAFVEVCRRAVGVSAETGRAARAHVVVHIDYDTLVGGLREGSTCELDDGTPISAATARRLACDAGILPVVLGGESVPLDVGRDHRLATSAQRVALRLAYGGTCGIEGCETPFAWCQIHHIIPWLHGGETALENLIPLCNRHHHMAHEGHHEIEQAEGQIRLKPPKAA